MSQADLIAEARAAIHRMLMGMGSPEKRARAREYAAGAVTIALRDAGLIDGYGRLTSDGKPVLIEPATVPMDAFAVNPGEV